MLKFRFPIETFGNDRLLCLETKLNEEIYFFGSGLCGLGVE